MNNSIISYALRVHVYFSVLFSNNDLWIRTGRTAFCQCLNTNSMQRWDVHQYTNQHPVIISNDNTNHNHKTIEQTEKQAQYTYKRKEWNAENSCSIMQSTTKEWLRRSCLHTTHAQAHAQPNQTQTTNGENTTKWSRHDVVVNTKDIATQTWFTHYPYPPHFHQKHVWRNRRVWIQLISPFRRMLNRCTSSGRASHTAWECGWWWAQWGSGYERPTNKHTNTHRDTHAHTQTQPVYSVWRVNQY